MKRKRKTTLMLVLALVAVVAMSTVALAAMDRFGILDFFGQSENPIKPLEGVESLIEQDLGSAENALIRLSIREAMYDGFGLRVVAAIEPIDPDRYAVVDDVETPVPDGKMPIILDGATITSENAQLDGDEIFVPSDQFVMEDGALVQSAEGEVFSNVPELIRLNYALRSELEEARLSVSFHLENRATPRIVALSPQSQGEDYRILSAQVVYTQLAAYLNVVYEDHLPSPQDERFEVDDGVYYGTQRGRFFHSDPNCSGMEDAKTYELSEFLKRDSHPCPICLGASMPPAPRVIYFALLDGEKNEIASRGGGSGQHSVDERGVRTYRQISTLQSSYAIPDRIFLQPTEMGEWMGVEPIECAVQK